ncbi:MAG: hypothetical protein NTV44_05160 [Firmicutes bacterium]|nr:hypothetical protein [Bacillota bacterium]
MEEIYQKIEEKRAAFMAYYKKQKLYNNIAMIAVVAVVISAYVFVQGMLNLQYLTLGIVAATLVILLVYSRIMRKRVDKATKTYINEYYDLQTSLVFPSDKFANAKIEMTARLEEKEFTDAGIIKEIIKTSSRGLITTSYGDAKISLADLAAYDTVDRKKGPVFLGKYLTCDNHLSLDGRILIYIKPKIAGKGPNDLSDVKEVLATETRVIYASTSDYSNVITKRVLDVIDSINVNETLTDVTISIKSGKTYIALSYNDSLMVIPLQSPFNSSPTDKYRLDIEKIAELITLIVIIITSLGIRLVKKSYLSAFCYPSKEAVLWI